jgi:hypothetical protein
MVVRCALVLVALALLLFLWQGLTAARALVDARATAERLSQAITAGNVQRARSDLRVFDEQVTRAHHRTDGPIWWLAAHVPLVGPNVAAVRTVAAQSDAIADEALPRIVAVSDQVRLETFRPKNGRVNLAAVAKALPVLATTDRVFARADREVAALRPAQVIGPLQQPVTAFQQQMHSAATGVAAAHDAGRLLPTMLGGNGRTRRYLLLVMNNAEVRSLGGMPGSFAILEARRGKIRMTEQASNTDLSPTTVKLLAQRPRVKPELRGGFDKSVGADIRETMIIPDFPRAAGLASHIAGTYWDTRFDGVIGIDPVTLGYVLGAVGQVPIGGDMVINQANAVPTLLNGIYLRYTDDPKAQDDAFKHAARRTFDALTGGRGNSVLAIRALVRGVQERRILLWSKHPAEQARIQSTGIAGSMTDRRELARPQLGLFLTDTTQGKMDYYLRSTTQVTATNCYADGVQDIRMSTTLSSEAPQSGPVLPDSVTGTGKTVGKGNIGLSVRVMAPPKGEIRAIRVDGHPSPVGATFYGGRQLKRIIRVLQPGESTVIVTRFRSGPGAAGDPLLRATPGVLPNDDIVGPTACH